MPDFYRDLDEHGQPTRRERCPDCGMPLEFGDLCECQEKSPPQGFVMRKPQWSDAPSEVALALHRLAEAEAARAIALGLPPDAPIREVWAAEDREMRRLLGLPLDAPIADVLEGCMGLGLPRIGATLAQVRAAVTATRAKEASERRGGRPVARAG